MSFGFSISDFLGVLKLAADLSKALSETRGVPIELRRLITMLESLQKAINNVLQAANEWDLTHANPLNKALLNGLAEEHSLCKRLLENFWTDSEKYTQSIINGQGSRVKREWTKIKWCMFHSDDAVRLERNLRGHVMAIDIYSRELRCRILKDIVSLNSLELTVMGRNIRDISKSVRQFEQLLQSILNSILNYSREHPTACLTPLEANVKLLDATGRELEVPPYLTKTPDLFHGYLELIYKDQPGHGKIIRQEYRLADEDSDGALITRYNWTQLVKPGKAISLSMVLRKSSARERACPRCNILCTGPPLFGQRLRCILCQVTFQVFNEERIIELPEKPSILGRDPTTKRVQTTSSGTASPSNTAKIPPTPKIQDCTLRYEDAFQRIHIIREITRIKGRGPNTGVTDGYEMEAYGTPLLPNYDKSLVEAAKNEDIDTLKAVLDVDKSPDESYLFVAARNWLPLPVFELLIAAGEDINRLDQFNRAPLHITCEWSAEISALLIAKGANPKAVAIDLSTPLHHAGSPEVARLLILHGADVDGVNRSKRTPLIEASARGLENLARVLVGNGADVEAMDEEGRTALSYSQIEVITRLLLEFGASPDSLDNDNMTPLHHSWLVGCVQALIEYGGDVNARSVDGRTPLHMAECLSVAKALLDNGADANATDISGRTPLHASVRSKYFKDDVARVLLEHGAEVNARDLEGRTPLHWAKKLCQDVLIEYGADMQAIGNSDQTKDPFVRNYNCATFPEISGWMDDERIHNANSTLRRSPSTKKLPWTAGQPCKRSHHYT